MNPNKHIFGGSSSLTHCDYNEAKQQLEICFGSGNTYHYDNVPKKVYEALKNAESPGKHFHQNIRNKIAGRKKE